MNVWSDGKKITLQKKDFVGQGGEASVYGRDGVAYKIFHDKSKVVASEKLLELQAIASSQVIVPQSMVFNDKKEAIGYVMRHLSDCYTLCELFPRAFRQRHSLEDTTIEALILQLRKGILAVHGAKVLVVDGNEMNFLVRQDFKELYFVDVDSYQTTHYPASAIMLSVRDPLVVSTNFSKGSDWFSFAVVAFQLLVGIHPYKGKHPSCKGLESRMRAGISVFDSDVRIPKSITAIESIPDSYHQWFRKIFTLGERCVPPDKFGVGRLVSGRVVEHELSGSLSFRCVLELGERVLGSWSNGSGRISVSSGYLWKGPIRSNKLPEGFQGVVFDGESGAYAVSLREGALRFIEVVGRAELEWKGHARALSLHQETLYVLQSDHLVELRVTIAGKNPLVVARRISRVHTNTARLYPGLVVQTLLGSTYLSLLTEPGLSYQIAIPELSGVVVVDAKLLAPVLVVVGYQDSSLCRYVFRFNSSYEDYDLRIEEDIDLPTVNFAVLDSGVCVLVRGDDSLEVFSQTMGSKNIERLEKSGISEDMKLQSCGNELHVLYENRLMKVSMS